MEKGQSSESSELDITHICQVMPVNALQQDSDTENNSLKLVWDCCQSPFLEPGSLPASKQITLFLLRAIHYTGGKKKNIESSVFYA